MAGVDAVSDGYRRVASHRPQRGGHVSYVCVTIHTYINWCSGSRCCYNDITVKTLMLPLLLIQTLEEKPLANQR